MKRKICIVTGTRAEYGLLSNLIKKIDIDETLSLQLIVTGMHLSPEFGLTYKEIENDKIKITKKIEMLLSSDTPIALSKSMGLAQISFSEAFEELQPDIVVLLGDRYEIFSVAAAAMIARIPIAHLQGGEATEGSIDEPIRHSITKMSHLHFTSTETHKNRVIQLGESPERVFNVGALGVENIKYTSLLSQKKLENSLNLTFNKRNLLITFHSVTLDKKTASSQFSQLLKSLKKLKDTNLIFTKANSDTDGRIINAMIDTFISENNNAFSFLSLGQQRYFSCLKHLDGVIGNSSSGILEAPSFKIGTVNIGDRQRGRAQAKSIINCSPEEKHIDQALTTLFTKDFQNSLQSISNPYEKNDTYKTIIKVLKKTPLDHIIKKSFYNLEKQHEH